MELWTLIDCVNISERSEAAKILFSQILVPNCFSLRVLLPKKCKNNKIKYDQYSVLELIFRN